MKANTLEAFIVFASGQIDVSVIDCLCATGSFDLIGYSKDAEDAVIQVYQNKPQLVIIDSRNAAEAAFRVIRELWNMKLLVMII